MYVVTKLIGFWLSPLPLLVALSCVGIWRCRRTPAAVWLALVTFGLWATSAEVVVRPLIAHLESAHPRRVPGPADAIVVLGGYSDPALQPSGPPEFHGGVDRVVAGHRLLLRGVAPVLLLSGAASSPISREEPEAMRVGRWLETLGVRPEQLVLEARSRNTAGNARETARLAAQHGFTKLVLVTSAMHMPRAVACFEKLGLDATPFPVDHIARGTPLGIASFIPSERWLMHSKRLWHELAGTLYYRLTGRI